MELLIPIAMILLGLALLTLEIYLVPGVNVVGVVGVISMAGGIVYAFVTISILAGIVALLSGLLAAGGIVMYLWQTDAWQRLVLRDALTRDELTEAAERDSRARWLGKFGTAVTPLRPTGVIEVDGDRLEVVTEGAFIAAGSRVKVVAMDRRRFFVRLAADEVSLRSQPEGA